MVSEFAAKLTLVGASPFGPRGDGGDDGLEPVDSPVGCDVITVAPSAVSAGRVAESPSAKSASSRSGGSYS